MSSLINARVKLNNYSNRVFGVIKSKYDLKDKSEAINKFVELYGPNEISLDIKEEYINKLNDIQKNHLNKYKYKKMSKKQLDMLFE